MSVCTSIVLLTERARPQLILLRLTVDLLKRLSKTNNAEFNGRVLMWLAYVLPLSERSGKPALLPHAGPLIVTLRREPEERVEHC